MSRAIDTTAAAVRDFRDVLAARLRATDALYDPRKGGVLNDVAEAYEHEDKTVSDVADRSLALIAADREYAVLSLDSCKEALQNCREGLRDARLATQRVKAEAARDGSAGGTTSAKSAEQARAASERAVALAESREAELESRERKLTAAVKTLGDLIDRLDERRAEIERYVSDSRDVIRKAKNILKRAGSDRKRLESRVSRCDDVAARAAGAVERMDAALSAASGGRPSARKRVCVSSSDYLRNGALRLDRARERVSLLSAELTEICGTLTRVMRDEVTAKASQLARRAADAAASETDDLAARGEKLRLAADELDAYVGLIDRL